MTYPLVHASIKYYVCDSRYSCQARCIKAMRLFGHCLTGVRVSLSSYLLTDVEKIYPEK